MKNLPRVEWQMPETNRSGRLQKVWPIKWSPEFLSLICRFQISFCGNARAAKGRFCVIQNNEVASLKARHFRNR